LLILFASCSSSVSQKTDVHSQTAAKEDKIAVQPKEAQKGLVTSVGQKPTLQAPPVWEEYSEEDRAAEMALDEAMISISKAFKRGRIETIQSNAPICLVLKKDEHGNGKIDLYRLPAQPTQKPIIALGEWIEGYTLPYDIIFQEQDRYFWYDREGNVDFFEPDRILRTFDNPPQGDILLLPKNPNIPRRGVIDVNKIRTQMECHQYLIP
jgi:hypothetical protein